MLSADLLREARLRAGLTQSELARRSGRTQPAIARWESGRVQPSLETLRVLIRACGLELTFGLANYDDSYDSLIAAQLRLSPAERVASHVAGTRVVRDIQQNAAHEGAANQPDAMEGLRVLQAHNVDFIVIGDVAAAAHGSPLVAATLTITPRRDAATAARLSDALAAIRALDVISVPPGTTGYEDLRRDAVELELGVHRPVAVASLADVIRINEASARTYDQMQLPALRRALEIVRAREADEDAA